MRYGIEEYNWGHIGTVLARESDKEQVAFFKSFCKECLSWGTKQQVESQLAFINMKLEDDEKEMLRMITYISD